MNHTNSGFDFLAKLGDERSNGFLEAFAFAGLVSDLEVHGLQNPEDFGELCRLVVEAYPSVKPTDAEVLANNITPEVVRFIVTAFDRYLTRLPAALASGRRHGSLLADVMFATGQLGRRRSVWTIPNVVLCLQSAGDAYGRAISRGETHAMASSAALEAADGTMRRGSDSEESSKNRRKRRVLLKVLLKEHGYYWIDDEKPQK